MPRTDHTTLSTIGLALGLATLALVATLSLRSTGKAVEANAWVGYTREALAAEDVVLASLQEAAAQQRAFLLTGQEGYLRQFARASQGLANQVESLAALTSDNPDQQRRLDRLRPLIAMRIAGLERTIAVRRDAPADLPLALPVLVSEGESLVREARAILREIEHEEQRLLMLRQQRASRTAGLAAGGVLAASATSALLLLLAFVALRREIAQRRRAEEEARKHAAEVEDLYNLAPCGYHSLDASGRIVRMNDTELAWLGRTREEVVGRLRFRDLLTPDSAARFDSSFPRFLETGRVHDLDFDLVRKDGGVLTVSLSASAVRDESGRFLSSRSTAFDVTGRRQLEADYERIFTLSQDLLCVADAQGRFVRVNATWERVLGHSTGEILGLPFIELVHPDDRQATLEVFERQIRDGASVTSFENRYRTKDGAYVVLLWSSTPLPSAGLVYASARDVTERKRSEEALSAATAAAKAANHELEAFSYSVSHDLRAPLRAIDGFSHALIEDYGASLDGEARRYLERICSATRRMSDLIEDLLKLSRISRAQITRQRIDLSALAEEVVTALRRSEPEREVEVVIAPGLEVWGDARLVRILLENLLGNAWKYTSKREHARIELDRAIVDGEPAWLVRDDGAGFDMAHAERLFGAFQRLHRAEEFEGTGVGLATTERIVRLHGGRIWAEAAVDEGATFFFTLGPQTEAR